MALRAKGEEERLAIQCRQRLHGASAWYRCDARGLGFKVRKYCRIAERRKMDATSPPLGNGSMCQSRYGRERGNPAPVRVRAAPSTATTRGRERASVLVPRYRCLNPLLLLLLDLAAAVTKGL